MKSGNKTPEIDIENFDRKCLLRVNLELIDSLRNRLSGKRFRPQEGDALKIQYMKTLIHALKCCNDILKDNELEEIKARLEALENLDNVPLIPPSKN